MKAMISIYKESQLMLLESAAYWRMTSSVLDVICATAKIIKAGIYKNCIAPPLFDVKDSQSVLLLASGAQSIGSFGF